MPYKDPEHKRTWELQHRAQRRIRRRELRRLAAAQKDARPETPTVQDSGADFLWLPVAGCAALAAFNPKLAIGAGGLTLAAAATFKKSWTWWLVGALITLIGLCFQFNDWSKKKEMKSQI